MKSRKSRNYHGNSIADDLDKGLARLSSRKTNHALLASGRAKAQKIIDSYKKKSRRKSRRRSHRKSHRRRSHRHRKSGRRSHRRRSHRHRKSGRKSRSSKRRHVRCDNQKSKSKCVNLRRSGRKCVWRGDQFGCRPQRIPGRR